MQGCLHKKDTYLLFNILGIRGEGTGGRGEGTCLPTFESRGDFPHFFQSPYENNRQMRDSNSRFNEIKLEYDVNGH